MKLLTNKLKDKVKKILIEKPATRDCDRLLTATIWFNEAKDKTAVWHLYAFFRNYVDGKLTLADSITRARRKLQEDHIELRGNNWYKRKLKAEDVRQEIIESKYL
jgi:hypothetical protein